MISFISGFNFKLKSAHYCFLPYVSLFFFQTAVLTKSILLISCHNFRFFSLRAKVFPLFSILVFQSDIMLCKMFFLLHFSIMFGRWFDDQDFIVVFNFFSIFEKCWKYGKDLFVCFVDIEKV